MTAFRETMQQEVELKEKLICGCLRLSRRGLRCRGGDRQTDKNTDATQL